MMARILEMAQGFFVVLTGLASPVVLLRMTLFLVRKLEFGYFQNSHHSFASAWDCSMIGAASLTIGRAGML